MKISVIVPTYNYGHFIPDLCQSLIKQTYSNWECLITDTCSTDDTENICKPIIQSDSRFIYLKEKSGNPSATRNSAFRKATGNFIQFLDADDIIDYRKFEVQLNLFASDKMADIIYGDYMLTDENLQNHFKPLKKLILSSNPFNDFITRWEKDLTIPIHSYLIKRECFDKWGLMDESIRTHEDWELQLKFSINGAHYKYHPDCVAYYRIHKSSTSRSDRTVNRKDTLDVLMKYFRDNRLSNYQKYLIVKRYIEFTGEIILDKFRIKNMKLFKALRFFERPLLNSIALFVFPFYLVDKTIRKVLGR
jgi:glycosyltransferase involved in cell wall biosynthesis